MVEPNRRPIAGRVHEKVQIRVIPDLWRKVCLELIKGVYLAHGQGGYSGSQVRNFNPLDPIQINGMVPR